MTERHLDLSQILQIRLAEIAEKNPQFSLRALARKLQISPSHLSRVLRGEKQFSYQSTLRLARELDLSPSQTERILQSLGKKNGQSQKQKKAEEDDRSLRVLEFETFRLIADWYHFPILELIRTTDFISDEVWIAKRLTLPVPVVTTALKRLETLGFIIRRKGEIKLQQVELYKTPNDVQSIAIRKHHAQMLNKAGEALETQGIHEREYQALNLNFNASDMEEAKKEIREFTKKFTRKFSRKSGEDVYQLNIQFFSLTQEKP